ncbi:MAG TPA: hypothetical protein PKN33_06000 [Phycisphaerae bacterium]|nr:hypothetical protein [Phycisphaerae bacterium]
MPITLMCPNLSCRAVLRVPDRVRGKKVRCGQCGMVFSVPSQGTPAVATVGSKEPKSK